MTDRRYLKWYNKIGYGAGDIAGNVIYAFISTFIMIYLTDTAGLNAGIVGTLMMISKFFDGFTDVIFGALIDKTKTKMGKARPWMLWPSIGNSVMLVALFAVPMEFGDVAKYAYFFICYTLLHAVFYTANNIAYSALTALITRNGNERVQMGSIRFIFAFSTSLLIQWGTVKAVELCGGGAEGWRTVAIIYAIIGLVVNTISVFSVKELPEKELEKENPADEEAAKFSAEAFPDLELADKDNRTKDESKKYTLIDATKLLLSNKYYVLICGVYILTQLFSATLSMGIYYMTYILGDADMLGTFSLAINVPMICGLLITPFLVKKCKGMYKLNLTGYLISTIARALVMVGGYMQNIPMMLIFTGVAAIAMSPMQGDLNALIAACSDYTYRTTGKRIDGTMYSCSSLGVKIGGGIGTALTGWLLAAGGYVANAPVQPESCINMLNFMYLWLPMLLNLVITLLLSGLNVEKANEDWDKTHAVTTEEV
ncbi:MAG: MFS transporter [Oscillospiraceae bacterium]|nr:MFS transporter [Oscillospiraceae bacterium]